MRAKLQVKDGKKVNLQLRDVFGKAAVHKEVKDELKRSDRLKMFSPYKVLGWTYER